jgi:lambda repressor-like predicted transcriptional regulator
MIDEALLRRLYLQEQQSIRAIAVFIDVPPRVVYGELIRYRIPRRPVGFRGAPADRADTCIDEPTLRQWYETEGLSIRAISARANVSTRTVYDALIRYHIPRRTAGSPRPLPPGAATADGIFDEATLRHLYQEAGKSIAVIAEDSHCSPSRIRNALVRYGIARRRRGRRAGVLPE